MAADTTCRNGAAGSGQVVVVELLEVAEEIEERDGRASGPPLQLLLLLHPRSGSDGKNTIWL